MYVSFGENESMAAADRLTLQRIPCGPRDTLSERVYIQNNVTLTRNFRNVVENSNISNVLLLFQNLFNSKIDRVSPRAEPVVLPRRAGSFKHTRARETLFKTTVLRLTVTKRMPRSRSPEMYCVYIKRRFRKSRVCTRLIGITYVCFIRIPFFREFR